MSGRGCDWYRTTWAAFASRPVACDGALRIVQERGNDETLEVCKVHHFVALRGGARLRFVRMSEAPPARAEGK